MYTRGSVIWFTDHSENLHPRAVTGVGRPRGLKRDIKTGPPETEGRNARQKLGFESTGARIYNAPHSAG
jgi:hypothetical protein